MVIEAVGARQRNEGQGKSSPIAEVIPEERAIVEAAKRNPQAFAALYDFYLPLIYRYCFLRLRSTELAEDATSIIFTKAVATVRTCRSDRFRAWLFTIARNVVIDVYRNQKPVVPLDRSESLIDSRNNPLDHAIWSDDERTVASLLSQLPQDQAEIVALRLSGLKGVEIARATGKSQGSVRIAQFRAYARLRELVGSREFTLGETS